MKHQPLAFSPFMRSLSLASRRSKQEDSQRSEELMSFGE